MLDELAIARASAWRINLAAALLVALLFGFAFAWAALTTMESAVVGRGELVADGSRRKIQHAEGGIVADILVRDGDLVAAGQVLIRLDDTAIRSGLGAIMARVEEFSVRQARLEAELAGEARMTIAPEYLHGGAAAAETALFEARRRTNGKIAEQFAEKTVQLGEEVAGLDAQRRARLAERELALAELKSVEPLFAKGLVTLPRLLGLQRTVAAADGEVGRIDAAIASARSAIAETGLRAAQAATDFTREAAAELAQVRGQLAELSERRVAASDQLARTSIVAPLAGYVHRLAVHTQGGVVRAGESLLEIVPAPARLVAEARVSPEEVDRIRVGAPARLRVRAGNQRLLPEVEGSVTLVSADAATDERTGLSYFLVRAALPADAGRELGDLRLTSGMAVDAFIQTGARSPLEFLLQPLLEQIGRAWRER